MPSNDPYTTTVEICGPTTTVCVQRRHFLFLFLTTSALRSRNSISALSTRSLSSPQSETHCSTILPRCSSERFCYIPHVKLGFIVHCEEEVKPDSRIRTIVGFCTSPQIIQRFFFFSIIEFLNSTKQFVGCKKLSEFLSKVFASKQDLDVFIVSCKTETKKEKKLNKHTNKVKAVRNILVSSKSSSLDCMFSVQEGQDFYTCHNPDYGKQRS